MALHICPYILCSSQATAKAEGAAMSAEEAVIFFTAPISSQAHTRLSVAGGRKGAAAPQQSRVCASLRSTSSLSLRSGQALDCFHPAGKRTIIGLSPKALLPIFSFLSASHSGAGSPRTPFAFFAWLAHVPPELAERIRSSPARREEGTRRAWGLRECAESATLSPCQQRKKGCFWLSLPSLY